MLLEAGKGDQPLEVSGSEEARKKITIGSETQENGGKKSFSKNCYKKHTWIADMTLMNVDQNELIHSIV